MSVSLRSLRSFPTRRLNHHHGSSTTPTEAIDATSTVASTASISSPLCLSHLAEFHHHSLKEFYKSLKATFNHFSINLPFTTTMHSFAVAALALASSVAAMPNYYPPHSTTTTAHSSAAAHTTSHSSAHSTTTHSSATPTPTLNSFSYGTSSLPDWRMASADR